MRIRKKNHPRFPKSLPHSLAYDKDKDLPAAALLDA